MEREDLLTAGPLLLFKSNLGMLAEYFRVC